MGILIDVDLKAVIIMINSLCSTDKINFNLQSIWEQWQADQQRAEVEIQVGKEMTGQILKYEVLFQSLSPAPGRRDLALWEQGNPEENSNCRIRGYPYGRQGMSSVCAQCFTSAQGNVLILYLFFHPSTQRLADYLSAAMC